MRDIYIHIHTHCPEKVQPLLTWRQWFVQHQHNLAAKEIGLECAFVNNDDFTVLVSGDGRHHGVSVCMVWPACSKWLSEESNEYASNFALSLDIPLRKLFGWLRRPQLWATGDWQLHHDNASTQVSPIMQLFLAKHQITQVARLPCSPDIMPCDFWLFPKPKSPWKGRDVRPSVRFRKIQWSSWCWLGELCEVPRCLLQRVLRCHCLMYTVSYILYLV